MPRLTRDEVFESTTEAAELAEIENLRTIIWNYSEAIQYLIKNSHQSYQLDTGQTTQRVTRLDLRSLIDTRKILVSELDERLSAAGLRRSVVTVRPAF